jgi:hypothetical protein
LAQRGSHFINNGAANALQFSLGGFGQLIDVSLGSLSEFGYGG